MLGPVTLNRLCLLLVQLHCSFFDANQLQARHQDRDQSKATATPGQQQQGGTQRILMAPLRKKRFLPLCSPACAPHAVCTATYIALASSEFMLSRQQHFLTRKSSSNLYVLSFQKRFSAAGCFEIKLHREGGRTERHFLCLLPGSKFSYLFLISHC